MARSRTPEASCACAYGTSACTISARVRCAAPRAEAVLLGLREQIRVVVRRAAEHHAVDALELARRSPRAS